ncbi:VPLPA-CTERM sorting domain-containing protein [Rhodobacteraceae bacterium SC52]|nr:VPLPA-CTERM sorting domain-containing protein [Rhodobacteraceae bacterium SC52]
MMNRLSLLSAICGLAFAANAANAAITEVFSVAGLTQGPYSLETFDDLTLVPGVTASASTGLALATTSFAPTFPSGTTGLTADGFPDPITFTFASAASSVGMFFGNDDTCCSSGFSANLDIFGTSGLLGTLSVAANMNDSVDQFIGFISDEAVTSVTIRYGSGTDVSLYTVVDDLRFNSTNPPPVPLPAGLPLAATGLAALALFKRRKT